MIKKHLLALACAGVLINASISAFADSADADPGTNMPAPNATGTGVGTKPSGGSALPPGTGSEHDANGNTTAPSADESRVGTDRHDAADGGSSDEGSSTRPGGSASPSKARPAQ